MGAHAEPREHACSPFQQPWWSAYQEVIRWFREVSQKFGRHDGVVQED